MTCLVSLFSGLLLAISQLNLFTGWIVFIAYIPLIAVTHTGNPKKTFKYSFLAVGLYYVIVLNWITLAINSYTQICFSFSILLLFLLSTVIALYMAALFYVARCLSIYFNWSYLWFFPVTLCLSEYLKEYGYVVSFPWGASAYSLLSIPFISQAASLVGIYGLVFFIGLINASIFGFFVQNKKSKKLQITSLIVLVILISYGLLRLNNYSDNFKKINISTLQGNTKHIINHGSFNNKIAILDKYNRLQERAILNNAKIIVWPESSYPDWILRNSSKIPKLKSAAEINIIPAISIDSANKVYNTAFIVDKNKDIVSFFDKNHLVPFGEYIPWPFGFLFKKIIPNLVNYHRNTISNPFLAQVISSNAAEKKTVSLATIICYDGAFPKVSRNFVKKGANLLINVTNDAWYGKSLEPYQHLRMYQMRAIETARSYVRATSTGISAWIDSRGIIHEATNLFEESLIVANVPILNETTVYQIIGDLVPKMCLFFFMVCMIFWKFPKSKFNILLLIFGACIILASCFFLKQTTFLLDESIQTQKTTITLIGLLIWFIISNKKDIYKC